PLRSATLEREPELPDQIIDILETAVGPARAKRRHDMGRIAGEQHAAVPEALHPAALERVDAGPLDLELALVAQHRAQAWEASLWVACLLGFGGPAKLESDPPDVVRLPVQERRLASVEWRVEPEPALGREFRFHVHIDDQEAIV